MGILETLAARAFPEGNLQNIKANAPNQMSYNIDATRDLVQNQPFNPLAPGLAFGLSLPYDTFQGIGRAFKDVKSEPGILDYDNIPNDITFADIGKSIAAENPIDSLIGRTYGAILGTGDKLTDYAQGLKSLFDSSVLANEPQLNIEDFQTQNIEELPPVASIPNNFLNYNFKNDRNRFTPINEGILSIKNKLGDLKDSGIDLGRLALSGMGRLAAGPVGGILGSIIGSVKESPEQKAMKNFYGNEFGLDDIGRVQSGVMKGYAPVSLFGGVGLNQAIDKRLAAILKTEENKKKKGLELSQDLIKRRKELEALKAKESAAASTFLESQRLGRRPSAPSGDGVKDSGGPTGGYSYDSGGREGFGYGL